MDNQIIYQIFSSMISKMNDEEIEVALKKAQSAMSEKDFLKLEEMVHGNQKKEDNEL